jgi:lipoate-protein ligase A
LSTGGYKFSGNAFCFRKGRALHHGTLLLQTDLERLGRYLGAMIAGIDTHAIASVPASVMNLDLDIEELSKALKEHCRHLYRDTAATIQWEIDDLDAHILGNLLEKQQSDDWKYGVTPRFQLDTGGTRLEISKGIVVKADGPLRATVEGKFFAEIAFSSFC